MAASKEEITAREAARSVIVDCSQMAIAAKLRRDTLVVRYLEKKVQPIPWLASSLRT